ncbi:hypothetical protein Lesp02_67830 [Lentzea sp. NBRC 105346]|nr:hypothetical protein Lesp02_67830 [Lentzea sp. NBRC 105346]
MAEAAAAYRCAQSGAELAASDRGVSPWHSNESRTRSRPNNTPTRQVNPKRRWMEAFYYPAPKQTKPTPAA